MTEQIQHLSERIRKILDEKVAQDVEVLDISEKTIVADAFILASGRTAIQVRALAGEVQDTLQKEYSLQPLHIEGMDAGRWVLLDYGTVVVHIFHKEEREFYNLERLWQSYGLQSASDDEA